MIVKSYEINKIDFNKNKIFLFYGENNGLKKETISEIINSNKEKTVLNYDEREILDNPEILFDNIFSKSLFDKYKTITIKRATDKIFKIIEKINEIEIEDLLIILNSDNLEKKSKLRSLFEKSSKLLCIPCYPDNQQTLARLAYTFFKQKEISISSIMINIIVNKCKSDRENLFNELRKIEFFVKNGKKITEKNISRLINISENHELSEFVDSCLAKDVKKTIRILNENNFNNDDCIAITRIFLNKSKKILNLSKEFKKNKNIDLTISSAKPPIFWKDKELVKEQIYNWSPEKIKKLIYELTEVELLIKKNLNNSIKLITNFALEQTSRKTNN